MYRPSAQHLGHCDWRLGYAKGPATEPPPTVFDAEKIRRWIPARVPGNVRDDLMRAGMLPDLFFGRTHAEHAWIDDCLWWYEADVPVARRPGERMFLDFRGVDYRSVVFWNHTRLGANDGMYSRLLYEVTPLIEDTNTIRVRLAGTKYLPRPGQTATGRLTRRVAARFQGGEVEAERFGTLKCQLGYGWEFAPELHTVGLWDDVFLHTAGPVFVERMSLTASLQPDAREGRLRLRAAVNTATAGQYIMQVLVAGDTCDAPLQTFEFPVYFQAGREVIERNVVVPDVQPWQTWDRGDPALYRVTLRIASDHGVVDELVERVGFRTVRMTRNPDAPFGTPDWTFVLNEEPVFVRGANWLPADSLPGRLARDDYAELIELARNANINLLRVWAGGLREKADFYDLCAEAGIMVWQDFPFVGAGPDRLPRSRAYQQLVEKEIGAIVKAVHNSPAVVAYCAGEDVDAERNEHVIEIARRVLGALDPDRPFLEPVPRPGDERHRDVWRQRASLRALTVGGGAFCSALGLQAPPVVETLQQCLPEAELWPPGGAWADHGADLGRLERYAKPMGTWDDLDGFVAATQRAQAFALQLGIEHLRRRKRACSGVLVWHFNDSWPAISWSVVDYFRRPKLAYDALYRAFQPVLVSVRYALKRYRPGDAVTLDVWVINDTVERFEECRVEIFMLGEEGRVFSMGLTVDEVPPNSVGSVLEFDLVLPDRPDATLYAELRHGGRVLSSNRYDLTQVDA